MNRSDPTAFLLLDCVDVDGDVFHAVKHVGHDEPYLEGHYPGDPVFPGAFVIECARLASRLAAAERLGRLPALAAVRSARFTAPIRPGQTLHLHGRLDFDERGGCEARHDCTLEDGTAVAKVTLAFGPGPA